MGTYNNLLKRPPIATATSEGLISSQEPTGFQEPISQPAHSSLKSNIVYPRHNADVEQFATTPPRPHATPLSRHPATSPSSHPDAIFAMVHEVLANKATEKTTLRFTTPLSNGLDEFLIQAKKQYKIRLPKNAVITLGLAYLLWDFEVHEERSLLHELLTQVQNSS